MSVGPLTSLKHEQISVCLNHRENVELLNCDYFETCFMAQLLGTAA